MGRFTAWQNPQTGDVEIHLSGQREGVEVAGIVPADLAEEQLDLGEWLVDELHAAGYHPTDAELDSLTEQIAQVAGQQSAA